MMVIGRLRPDRKTKYGTKSGRPRAPRRSELEVGTGARSRHGAPSTSLLEQLPTELIQVVFLFSANLHLPLCSKQLLSALTSDHLKYEITLQILVYQRDKLSLSDRSILLTRQFFTWEFLVRYVSFATPRVVIEIEDNTDESDEDLDDGDGYAATERSRSVASSRGHKGTDQPPFHQVDAELTARTKSAIMELRENEVSHLLEMPTTNMHNLDALRRIPSLQGLLDLCLPPTLLHGSWRNDDDRRLLRLFIAFNGTVSNSSSPDNSARNGILDAIQQEDEEVVSYFLGAQIGVAPDIGMLREAVKQTNLSVVYQLLRTSNGQIDMLDPQVWRLLAEHMTWTWEEKDMVESWLQNGVPQDVTEDDVDFLPKLKDISLDIGRWTVAKED